MIELPVAQFGWTCIGAGLLISANHDQELDYIRRAKEGDSQAFDRLVRLYQKRVYHLARRICLNHADADDVVQETFIKAYTHIRNFDESYKFFTWLYRITMNTALTLIKKRKRSGDSLDRVVADKGFQPVGSGATNQGAEENELTELVQQALAELSDEFRSVFVLRTFQELSYQEIAETLNISEGTVMSRLNRARTKLQRMLKERGVSVKR